MSLLLKAGDSIRTAPGALIRVPVKRRDIAESPAVTKHGAPKPGASRRNTTVDVLRGYCILMMITSHTSTQSYVNNGVHLLRFVSGAEGFVFLAGLVLGMVYRRKLDAAPASDSYRAILKRAGLLWTVHCALTLVAVVLNPILFHYADIPDVRQISPLRTLWLTATLQLQPGHMLNILPLYVFLLCAAPLCFELMRREKTAWLLAGSLALFAYCQFEPGAGRWVHPISGGDAFPVFAWQALFIPGMAIGYHNSLIRSTLLAHHRAKLMWTLGIACAVTLLLVAVQTPTFQFYNHETWDLFLWERHPLRFGRVLYFLLAVSTFYLLIQAWQNNSRRLHIPTFPLKVLETLGRNSLYAFLVHIAFAFGLGLLQIPPERWFALEVLPVVTVIGVYLMARYQVARRWIPN
jgi:hypothetical protein